MMNAKELLRLMAAGRIALVDPTTSHPHLTQEIVHRALSLLAAAEANDGTTPRTDAVPSEESRIKRLREWAHRALLREPSASIIERTVAEDVQHLEAKYQLDLAALREQLAERDAEIARLKAHADLMAYGKGTAAINAMVAYRAAYPKEADA